MSTQTKTVEMTAKEFLAHAGAEVAKAQANPATATEVLKSLQANIERLQKGSWEGSNDKVQVEMYEEDTTAKKDLTDSTTPALANAGKGTQTDGKTFAAEGGAQGFAKGGIVDELGKLNQAIATMLAPDAADKAATAPGPAPFVQDPWPRDVNSKEFMEKGALQKRDGSAADDWGSDPWAK